MVYVNDLEGMNVNVDLNKAADTIVVKLAGGWVFITHEGEMIGPGRDRDDVVAKAALYLSAFRGG